MAVFMPQLHLLMKTSMHTWLGCAPDQPDYKDNESYIYREVTRIKVYTSAMVQTGMGACSYILEGGGVRSIKWGGGGGGYTGLQSSVLAQVP